MTNKDSETLRLLPEATQSSYERVLEWNNQAEQEEARPIAFLRRPGSVPNDEHHPQGLSSLRDDMAVTDSNHPFNVIEFEQWGQHAGTLQMDQGKTNYVDEVSENAVLGLHNAFWTKIE